MLRPFVSELVELYDDGLCCGAGGAYSVLQPELAGQIRDRKVAAIDAVTPDVVASANPGCSMHLAQAGVALRSRLWDWGGSQTHLAALVLRKPLAGAAQTASVRVERD